MLVVAGRWAPDAGRSGGEPHRRAHRAEGSVALAERVHRVQPERFGGGERRTDVVDRTGRDAGSLQSPNPLLDGTVDQEYAENRQRFLTEQGYAYSILPAEALSDSPLEDAV